MNEETEFELHQPAELSSFDHVVLAFESRIQERGSGISLWLRRATEISYVSGVSLHGGPERPLCEAVKVKHGLF